MNEQVNERKVTIPRETYGVSTMQLVSVISTDRAKNVAVHSIDKEQTISVPGTKGQLLLIQTKLWSHNTKMYNRDLLKGLTVNLSLTSRFP